MCVIKCGYTGLDQHSHVLYLPSCLHSKLVMHPWNSRTILLGFGECWDCEASCCFSASPLSIKTSKHKHDLAALGKITDCCCACHFYLRKKSLHFSPTLCNTLDFLSSCLSVFLCLSLTVWQCDSGEETSSVLWGGMSAGVRCLSWHRWLLRVWVCVRACVNLMPACGHFRCASVLNIEHVSVNTLCYFCAFLHFHSRFVSCAVSL